MVTPLRLAKINMPRKETGKPAATQNAMRGLRNMDKNIRTSIIPEIPLFTNSFLRAFNTTDISLVTVSVIPV